ncbi:MAG: hypothetical protein WD058_08540, partial [Dehalococcoidia bacterium]
WLDQVYLALFLVVALRWDGTPRRVAVALYALRLAGFVTFEVSGARWVLVAFPNVFEFWFLFVAAVLHWRPTFAFTPRATAVALAVLTLAKLAHEYVIHVARALDSFTAIEAVEAIWGWLTW